MTDFEQQQSSSGHDAVEKKIAALYDEPANEITAENTYIDSETGTIQFKNVLAARVAGRQCVSTRWAAGLVAPSLLP